MLIVIKIMKRVVVNITKVDELLLLMLMLMLKILEMVLIEGLVMMEEMVLLMLEVMVLLLERIMVSEGEVELVGRERTTRRVAMEMVERFPIGGHDQLLVGRRNTLAEPTLS